MPSDRFQQKGNHSLFGLRGNKKSRFTRTRLKAFIESVRTVLSRLFSDRDQVAPANDSDTYFLFKHHVRLIMFSSQPRKFRKNNIRPVASLALGWGKRTSPRSLRNFNILASARCVSECGCKEKQKVAMLLGTVLYNAVARWALRKHRTIWDGLATHFARYG